MGSAAPKSLSRENLLSLSAVPPSFIHSRSELKELAFPSSSLFLALVYLALPFCLLSFLLSRRVLRETWWASAQGESCCCCSSFHGGGDQRTVNLVLNPGAFRYGA